jgi:hypothetical protein
MVSIANCNEAYRLLFEILGMDPVPVKGSEQCYGRYDIGYQTWLRGVLASIDFANCIRWAQIRLNARPDGSTIEYLCSRCSTCDVASPNCARRSETLGNQVRAKRSKESNTRRRRRFVH